MQPTRSYNMTCHCFSCVKNNVAYMIVAEIVVQSVESEQIKEAIVI